MHTRPAQVSDLYPLAQLFDAYRVFYEKPSDLDGARRFLVDRMRRKESEIFVAQTEASVLAGFVQLYPLFSSTRMKRLWLLNDLYVDPAYRGKGISILLIDAAKALARSTQSAGLLLETDKSNVIGNRLYPRTGFELDSDHNYYSWSE